MNIAEIQHRLRQENLDAYIVTHNNCFLGQDILPDENKLQYLCNFSGSDGALIITQEQIFLLVDGRYELQAKLETDAAQITIIHQVPRLKNICDILSNNNLQNVGYDAWCFSVNDWEYTQRKYKDLHFTDCGDWVELSISRPIEILERDVRYAGLSAQEKCQQLIDYLWQHQADYALITSADSVSWLLNIYSRDLPYTPIVRAYALISLHGEIILYGDLKQNTNLKCQNWQDLSHKLQEINGAGVIYDPHTTPIKIKQLASNSDNLIKTADLCQSIKAVKNATEQKGMINCHIRDGVALSKFICWLENNWQGQSEMSVVEKLHDYRCQQPDFFSESFATIAGMAENGAIVHYQPSGSSNKKLCSDSLLLIDSGGQYLDGTTDVTRTIALGQPTPQMITDFTQVLKAHIALAKSKFPDNTPGMKLDILPRHLMWQKGLDYKHGTGHGVACFGNVHEGPISISPNASSYGLTSGMVCSIEPGIYRENAYGIRIENLALIQEDTDISNQEQIYQKFIPLTKVPIDKKLIDKYLLSTEELAWLNEYHEDVYECLAPYLDEKEKIWLSKACAPLI